MIFKIVQTTQSLSHLPLFILQKQTNKVLSLGQQNKLLQRFRAAIAAAVRRVAAPYKSCANKSLQISRVDDIRPYRTLLHYSLLLITLSVSETTPQSRFTPSQLPYRGSLNRFCDKTQFINHKTDRSRYAAVGYCFTAPVYVPGTFLIPYCLYSCRLRVRLRSRPPLRWSAGALPLCGSRPR